MAARLFVSLDAADPETARLDASAARHLRALRLGAGDAFHAIVGPGSERHATIVRLSASGAECRLGAPLPASGADPSAPLILAIGLGELARMDVVVEKATELGATAIVPFRAQRSQRAALPAARLARWERIARAACEQCGRTIAPGIEPLASFEEVLDAASRSPRALVFAPGTVRSGSPATAARAQRGGAPCGDGALLVIGPEGGLTDGEIAALVARGARRASLGPRVLRFETAVIAALAAESVRRDLASEKTF